MANMKANQPSYSYIGKAAPRIEGEKKVSGQALYTADHLMAGTVWGKVLRSPYPHARLTRVNTDRAKAHAGVLAVLTAADIPDVLTGRRLRDMPMLANDRVRFIGEKVAVVAAAERDVAEEAAQLIEVDYEPLTPVFDPLMAITEGAPELHERLAEYEGLPKIGTPPKNTYSHEEWLLGDVEQGFREADQIFEDRFSTQHVHQAYLEPHSSVVSIDRDTGIIHVWVSNKVPYNTKNSLADAIGVPADKIVIHVSTIGGDFGGKGALMDLPLCYFLSHRLNRPVRMVMNYTDELTAANPRHAAQMVIKTGIRKDGRITARQIKVYWDGGAYGAMKPIPTVNLPGAVKAAGAYAIPNVRIDSYAIYTNSVPCGHFRSPGLVQLAFGSESQIDMIATAMKIDPLELRLRNALTDGFPTPDVKGMLGVKCKEVLETAAEATNWKTKNLPTHVGRGMALSYRHVGLGEANARMRLKPDGKISILTTFADTGTGAHTILCQMVAEVLDVPMNQIGLEVGTTDAFRSESGTGASRVTFVLGQAVLKAAAQFKALLCEAAAEMLGVSTDKIILKKGRLSTAQSGGRTLSLAELAGATAVKNIALETESYHAEHETPPEGVFAACIAEVAVDVSTGQLRVRKLDTIHDVATILNPTGHQGQIDGGIMQGVGYVLMEELAMEEGRVITANLGEYKVPNIQDIPPLKTTLVHSHEGASPFQSKEIGESAISQVAPAIANAIYDAVGVRIKDLPITAEKVFRALQERRAENHRLSSK
jgi:CO/xanthine dehydrogenase Mo-binding subunit